MKEINKTNNEQMISIASDLYQRRGWSSQWLKPTTKLSWHPLTTHSHIMLTQL